jgi:hypothetical protein
MFSTPQADPMQKKHMRTTTLSGPAVGSFLYLPPITIQECLSLVASTHVFSVGRLILYTREKYMKRDETTDCNICNS